MTYDLLDNTYPERVYAGVLGKIIGVYLGRPFEQWSHQAIEERFGEIDRYVHEDLGQRLVVTDDDISGTFTFIRALADYGYSPELTPAQIGESWLNYIIENRTILWWGGMGVSTEHTAFLRLKHGISAPESGSIGLNGKTVAEQIGAQIFIDGWAMMHPGDVDAAVDFARRAGSVSHDGEAIYGAQVVAGLIAQAFVRNDLPAMIREAVSHVPNDSVVTRMIGDLFQWKEEGRDWRGAFKGLEEFYGYDKYGGGCHMIPNHGIIILALLYGENDFSRSLMIANTCGWDTDCNSANVGCILGVMNGLAGIEARWRDPVADRLFMPTADGGRCISDAVQEASAIVKSALLLKGHEYADKPRFSFCHPGSVQGFHGEGVALSNPHGGLVVRLGRSQVSVMTATFASLEDRTMPGYTLMASPTLYAGQTVQVRVLAGESDVQASICWQAYNSSDELITFNSDPQQIPAGESVVLTCQVEGHPIAQVGLSLEGTVGDSVTIDWLTWTGSPQVDLKSFPEGRSWRDAWVNGVSDFNYWFKNYTVVQNEGTGLLIQGCREWTDLTVEATITPHLAEDFGLAVRVQGLRRYYALRLTRGGKAQLVKALEGISVLAETPFEWSFGEPITFLVKVEGKEIAGFLNGDEVLRVVDEDRLLESGGIGLLVTEGRVVTDEVRLRQNP